MFLISLLLTSYIVHACVPEAQVPFSAMRAEFYDRWIPDGHCTSCTYNVNLAHGRTLVVNSGFYAPTERALGFEGAGRATVQGLNPNEVYDFAVYQYLASYPNARVGKIKAGNYLHAPFKVLELPLNQTTPTYTGQATANGNGEIQFKFEILSGAFPLSGLSISARCSNDTCSDRIQNGDETGVDCGGSCVACGPYGLDTTPLDVQSCTASQPCSGVYNFSDWGARTHSAPYYAFKPGEMGDDKWLLVRRVHREYAGGDETNLTNLKGDPTNRDTRTSPHPNYGYWHPATDNMAGTAVYGEYDGNLISDSTFSIKFDHLNCEEFLFVKINGNVDGQCNMYGYKYSDHCVSVDAFVRIRRDELVGDDGQKEYSFADGFTTPYISSNNCCGKDPATCYPYPTRISGYSGCQARMNRQLNDTSTPWTSDDAQHVGKGGGVYAANKLQWNGLFVHQSSQGANLFCLLERSQRSLAARDAGTAYIRDPAAPPPPPTCNDNTQNGDETGLDCGGTCPACATCSDNTQNGDETGLDCGGSTCGPCAPTAAPGAVQDDPHFQGFDGSRYDFQGVPGAVFNLISDVNFQCNSKFVEAPDGKTYMGQLSFVTNGARVLVTPRETRLNDKKVESGFYSFGAGSMTFKGMKTVISAEGFKITVELARAETFVYLNIESRASSNLLISPHGLLGQTARYLVEGTRPQPRKVPHKNKNARGFIEGGPTDYLVVDGMYGIQFKFNRYQGTGKSLSSSGKRQHKFKLRAALRKAGIANKYAFGKATYQHDLTPQDE